MVGVVAAMVTGMIWSKRATSTVRRVNQPISSSFFGARTTNAPASCCMFAPTNTPLPNTSFSPKEKHEKTDICDITQNALPSFGRGPVNVVARRWR